MAILKIIGPIHPNINKTWYAPLGRSISYILDEKKTEGKYKGGILCSPSSSLDTMIKTTEFYEKIPTDKRSRIGYHFTISFPSNYKISPEDVLKITNEFCEACLPGYETVYAVHTDKGHLHSHIVFNSINALTGYKYRYEKNDWANIYQIKLDDLCVKYGHHSLAQDTGVTIEEYRELDNKNYCKPTNRKKSNNTYVHPNQYNWSDYIRQEIDNAILLSNDMTSFEYQLKTLDFDIKKSVNGSYWAIKTPGMQRYRRLHTLGDNYSLEAIKIRVSLKKEIPEVDGVHERIVIPKRFFKFQMKSSNPYIRKQYYELKQLGITKDRRYVPYKELKKRLKNIKRLEKQIFFLDKYNINSSEKIDVLLAQKKNNSDFVSSEIKKLNIQIKEFGKWNDLLNLYNDLLVKKEMYKDGYSIFEDEIEHINEIKTSVENIPLSGSELLKNIEALQSKRKELLTQRRELKEDISVLRNLYDSFDTKLLPEEKLSKVTSINSTKYINLVT